MSMSSRLVFNEHVATFTAARASYETYVFSFVYQKTLIIFSDEALRISFQIMKSVDAESSGCIMTVCSTCYTLAPYLGEIYTHPLPVVQPGWSTASMYFGVYTMSIWVSTDRGGFVVDTYDALTISGGLGDGLIPTRAMTELIRIVKPGINAAIYI